MRLTDRARTVLLVTAALAVLLLVMALVGGIDTTTTLPNDR